jgi:hydrogenase/urease accessory protein HupE
MRSRTASVYAVGFLATAAGLLVLDEPRAAWTLRIAGIAIATAGLYLVGRLLPPLAAI